MTFLNLIRKVGMFFRFCLVIVVTNFENEWIEYNIFEKMSFLRSHLISSNYTFSHPNTAEITLMTYGIPAPSPASPLPSLLSPSFPPPFPSSFLSPSSVTSSSVLLPGFSLPSPLLHSFVCLFPLPSLPLHLHPHPLAFPFLQSRKSWGDREGLSPPKFKLQRDTAGSCFMRSHKEYVTYYNFESAIVKLQFPLCILTILI